MNVWQLHDVRVCSSEVDSPQLCLRDRQQCPQRRRGSGHTSRGENSSLQAVPGTPHLYQEHSSESETPPPPTFCHICGSTGAHRTEYSLMLLIIAQMQWRGNKLWGPGFNLLTGPNLFMKCLNQFHPILNGCIINLIKTNLMYLALDDNYVHINKNNHKIILIHLFFKIKIWRTQNTK